MAGKTALPLPARLAERPPVGVVGRQSERDVIEGVVAQVASGAGPKLVAVSGPPGVGKSTIVAEVARVAHRAGAAVLYGWCEESFDVPYRPFLEAFGQYADHVPDEALRRHAAQHLADLARLVPALRWRSPQLPPAQTGEPDTERYLLFGAVAATLAELCIDAPVVLVIDDLHWADRPSLQLLRHLFGERGLDRLAVLGTYRSTDVSYSDPLIGMLTSLRNARRLESVVLSGFDDIDISAYVRAVAGTVVDEGMSALARSLSRLTGGNPFFVSELVRHLVESGTIAQREDGQWTVAVPLSAAGLPESIREVVEARVVRLGPTVQEVLEAAAVLGQEFDLELLAAAADIAEEQVLDALESAGRVELVVEVASRPGRFRFSHALIQQVLYDELSRARRGRVHSAAAIALERDTASDPGPRSGEIARHLIAAGARDDLVRAVRYCSLAGASALSALAPDEAVRWFGRALELLDRVPDEAERARALLGLGESRRRAGDPSSRDTLLEAARLAARLNDADVLVAAALANNRGFSSATGAVDEERVDVLEDALRVVGTDDSAPRASLLALLALELTHAGDYPARRALADEALDVARRVADPAVLAGVLSKRLLTLWVPDTLSERLAETAEAETLADRVGDAEVGFWACLRRAMVALEAGLPDEVDRCLARTENFSDAIRQPVLRWSVLFTRAWRRMLAGDLEGAEAEAIEALQLGNDTGQPDALTIFGAQLVSVRWHQGRLDEVVDLLAPIAASNPGLPGLMGLLSMCLAASGRQSEAASLLADAVVEGFDPPYDMFWLPTVVVWAEVAALLGDVVACDVLYRRLEPWHAQFVFSGTNGQGAVALHLGQLALVLGRLEAAEHHVREAAEIHSRLRATYFMARTDLARARLLAGRGEDAAARALAAEVRDGATKAGFADVARWAATLV